MTLRRFVKKGMMETMLACGLLAGPAWPQSDTPPSAPGAMESEQMLRGRLQQNVREREQLLQQLEEMGRKHDESLQKNERPQLYREMAAPTAESGASEEPPIYELADISIVSKRVQKHPEGMAFSATPRSETDSQPTRTMKESMESLPGVILRSANGPRDFGVSIRGSGVKTTGVVRDLKFYEDGIGQTQSDGFSRLDMHDPWFMQSVEVTRGASSSLYDNAALGGMIHFKTRRGSDINGLETFFSGGSYGYQKYAFGIGKEYGDVDVALFASQVAEDGYIRRSNYDTQTVNLNFRFKLGDKDNFYVKAVSNALNANVPTRLTLAQFNADHRQTGGTGPGNDAARLGQRRHDRRTIIGGLYERQIDASTVFTLEADYDVRDINQTFTQINDAFYPNFKGYADLRHDGRLGDMPLKSYAGFFANNMEQESQAFENLGDFRGSRGTLVQNSRGTIRNIGGRLREELEFVPKWTLAAGIGFQQSQVSVQTINYTAGALGSSPGADRTFYNWAPEVSVSWRPTEQHRHWVRASTGYSVPGFANLTTGLDGLAGTNFSIKPQKNYNFEIGTDSKLHKTFGVQLVGFWVLVKDEIITQVNSTTAGSFAINADSSQYRGVEASYDWRPAPGWRFSGAYTHIDAQYINFADQFRVNGVGPVTQVLRDGKYVPNVARDVLNLKQEYDHPSGWGGWLETTYWNSYFLNNNNTVGAPAYWLLNANLHKTIELNSTSWFRFAKFYLQLDNIADKRYVGSGGVIADSTPDANKTLFFAGYGRAIYGGVTLGLF
ncbi:MAG: TonB-dependent receptor [Nitrospira sp.]|nr:TonB-dependent receptor [Nitrospira sp.]